ncbi:MAG: radical SAM protein [Microbacteriaceae bacterium]|nr:radical SAM protein [Microbacteriaceae bacterium]
MSPTLVLDLVQATRRIARGTTVAVDFVGDAASAARIAREWCELSGHELVAASATEGIVVRTGRRRDPLADLEPDQRPGTRVWVYTNFDCNLACDYCCVRSSPRAERRAIGADRLEQIADEAVDAGVAELILTGGEPFLLPDIDALVSLCTRNLPTTLLTNGMLLTGTKVERLRRMDRDRLTLQISLDSPTPEVHDSHRGRGSWARAVKGIRTAQEEGFAVKVAATVPVTHMRELDPFHAFLDELGIAREHQVIRAIAHRGVADDGVELTVDTLVPEVTITADGVYWHPVAADHADQFVMAEIFPLQNAIDEVRRRFVELRLKADAAAEWFPCA